MKTENSKIYKAHQIMMAFELLGIEKSQFSNLKNQHGSLDGLYKWIETQLS